MSSINLHIIRAQQPTEFSDAALLIREYVEWLAIDLSFQNFHHEMLALPEMYNANDGGLFVAYLDTKPVGVVGLRRFSPGDGEVKRMFVKDEAKGMGIGKLLLKKCIEMAKTLGYTTIKLDTGDFMKAAIKLYTDHGFEEITAYRYNPHESARYFELDLRK